MKPWLRLLRHAWLDASDSRRALSPEAAARVAQRVAESESRHSGEIRICIEAALPLPELWPPPPDAAMPGLLRHRARHWFGQLQVWDTEHNNGVLVYVLLAERAIEIVADRGLSQRLEPGVWQAHLDTLRQAFRRGDFEQGLLAVVDDLDHWLRQHFPAAPGVANPNELPDAVVLC